MELKDISVDGQKIVYEQSGTGPQPVVVLHGWGCRASTVRLLAEAATTARTTVYNLDLPGFGDSPEPESDWDVYRYADLVEAFCRKLRLEKPVLIGHSFGGRLCIILGSRMPVSKIILVDAAGVKPRRSLSYYLKVYSFKLGKRLAPLLMGRKRADEWIDRRRRHAGSSDYAAASPRMRAIMSKVVNQDLRPLMPSITAPTLLIWGEKDTATPFRDALLMKKLIPDAGLVSYPEADHYSFLRRPDQTRAVVASFINS